MSWNRSRAFQNRSLFHRTAAHAETEHVFANSKQAPMGRIGEPRELAGALVLLASARFGCLELYHRPDIRRRWGIERVHRHDADK